MTQTEIPSHDDKCYLISPTSVFEIPDQVLISLFIKVTERNFAALVNKSRLMKDAYSETGTSKRAVRILLESFLVQG